MSTKARQIECLSRLDYLSGSKNEILGFLLLEKIITVDTIASVNKSPTPSKELQILLYDLQKTEKFQLLEYVWEVLPKEHISIMIVTDSVKKEFTYSAF